jgi:hypothetical protein
MDFYNFQLKMSMYNNFFGSPIEKISFQLTRYLPVSVDVYHMNTYEELIKKIYETCTVPGSSFSSIKVINRSTYSQFHLSGETEYVPLDNEQLLKDLIKYKREMKLTRILKD